MLFEKSTKFAFAFLVILSLIFVGLVDATPVPAERDLIPFPAKNVKRGFTSHHECNTLQEFFDIFGCLVKIGAFFYEEDEFFCITICTLPGTILVPELLQIEILVGGFVVKKGDIVVTILGELGVFLKIEKSLFLGIELLGLSVKVKVHGLVCAQFFLLGCGLDCPH